MEIKQLISQILKNKIFLNEDKEKNLEYYEGGIANSFNTRSKKKSLGKTPYNICQTIVDTKINNVLEMPFDTQVIPQIEVLDDYNKLNTSKILADIDNTEKINIFDENNIEEISENILRSASIYGAGISQVEIEEPKNNFNFKKIIIKYIPAKDWFYDGSINKKTLTYCGYVEEFNTSYAISKYARQSDKTLDTDIEKAINDNSTNNNYNKIFTNNDITSSLSVVKDSNNITYSKFNSLQNADASKTNNNKQVKIYHLYIKDDTIINPEIRQSNNEDTYIVNDFQSKYPYGRHVVFIGDTYENIIILDDEPCLNLGGDIFGGFDIYSNSNKDNALIGYDDIEKNITIQDIINTISNEYIGKIKTDRTKTMLNTNIIMDKGTDLSKLDDSTPYILANIPRDITPTIDLSNNHLAKAAPLVSQIEFWINKAYEINHINQLFVNGGQLDIQSGVQAEAMQQAPQSDIRTRRKNFKNWLISVSEKVVNCINNYYEEGRILSNDNQIGKIITPGENRYLHIIKQNTKDELNKIPELISLSSKLKVKVVAGLNTPRTRKEMSNLTNEVLNSPFLTNPNNPIELKIKYLEMQDSPNIRAFIPIFEDLNKQQIEAQKQQTENTTPLQTLLLDPIATKNAIELAKLLHDTGRETAFNELLNSVGLPTLQDVPTQQIDNQKTIVETQSKEIDNVIKMDQTNNFGVVL